jgi:hypothetical protein
MTKYRGGGILGGSEMVGPFPDHDADVLITRFEQHAQQLRHLDLYDVKIAGGFLTVQLLLGSWFAANPIGGLRTRLLLIAIDAAFLIVCWMIIRASRARRQVARVIIQNINSALGLDRAGTYLPDRSIYPSPDIPPRFYGYEIGVVVAFIGAALIIFLR